VYGCDVSLVERWNRVESGLDPRWSEVTLSLTINDDRARSRAAALLGPAGPGLAGKEIRFRVSKQGTGVGPEAVRRLLRRIDGERIVGRLELVESRGVRPGPEAATRSLAAEWDAGVAALPADWSDVLCELELVSSADLERAAVLAEPLNPLRTGTGRPCFRFRAARTRGYGASPGMTRRCLERLDGEEINGEVRIVRALSDTQPMQTQGPVWYVGGRAV
jgi:hypothetical protein